MRNNLSTEEIVAIIEEEESCLKVNELTRKYGISIITYHKWKAKYSGIIRAREWKIGRLKLGRTYSQKTGRVCI